MTTKLAFFFSVFFIIFTAFANGVERFESTNKAQVEWVEIVPDGVGFTRLHYRLAEDGFQDFVSKKFTADSKVVAGWKADLKKNSFRTVAQNYTYSAPIPEAKSGNRLWRVRNQWDWSWEVKFAEWVKENFTEDFYVRHNIKTDCADVAFTTRWIFARINGLPAANKLAGSSRIVSQDTMRSSWRNLPTDPVWHKDRRFRAALNYLMLNTYTHSLIWDSYPVALNSDGFREGIYYLSLHGASGHTQLIHRTALDDSTQLPFIVAASNLPRVVRMMQVGGLWASEQPRRRDGGFLSFRWPRKGSRGWYLVAENQMPHFSREQYEPDLVSEISNFTLAVMKRLNPEYDPKARVDDGIASIREQVVSRIETVEEGYAYCSRNGCPDGSQAYDDWSTPSRDARLLGTFEQLEDFIEANQNYEDFGPHYIESLRNQKAEVLGRTVSMNEVRFIWQSGLFNSDPNAAPDLRWSTAPSTIIGQLANTIRDTVNERQSRIARNSCRSRSCAPMSDGWMRAQSFDIDFKLQEAGNQALRFCEFAQAETCQEFARLADEMRMPIRRGQKRFSDLARDLFAWKSNPLTEKRWGENVRLVVSSDVNVQQSESGYTLVVYPMRSDLYRDSDGERLSSEYGQVYLHKSEPWLFSQVGDEVEVKDISNGEVVRRMGASGGVLSGTTADNWLNFYHGTESGFPELKLVHLLTGEEFSLPQVDSPSMSFDHDAEGFHTIVDSETGEIIVLHSDGKTEVAPLVSGTYGSTVLGSINTDNVLMVARAYDNIEDCHNGLCFKTSIWQVNLSTGTSSKVRDLGNGWASISRMTDELWSIVTYSATGASLKVLRSGDFEQIYSRNGCWAMRDGYVMCGMGPGPELLQIGPQGVRWSYRMRENESTAGGPYVISRNEDSNDQIVNKKTGETLLSAKRISRAGFSRSTIFVNPDETWKYPSAFRIVDGELREISSGAAAMSLSLGRIPLAGFPEEGHLERDGHRVSSGGPPFRALGWTRVADGVHAWIVE